MAEYLFPGVYVEEVDNGPKPIQGAGTAMPVFIGFSEKAEQSNVVDGETVVASVLGNAILVTNWSQYMESFGGFVSGAFLPHSVYGYFLNGGTRCYVVSVRTIPKAQLPLLNAEGAVVLVAQAKQAGLEGLNFRVKVLAKPLSVGDEEGNVPEIEPEDLAFDVVIEKKTPSGKWRESERLRKVQIQEVKLEDESTTVRVKYRNESQFIDLVIADKTQSALQLRPAASEAQALLIDDTKALEAPKSGEFRGDVVERQGLDGLQAIDDITMVCVPDLMTPLNGKLDLKMVQAVQTNIIAHCELMGDRVAILDAPPHMRPQAIRNWRVDTTGYDSSYAALYYPWIEVDDPVTQGPLLIPPSGHVAGVWARSDNTRGVHKAPANEVIRGATSLAYNCTNGEQAVLNPKNINCIRKFPGRGIRIWGARTLSSNPSWTYLNVRRLFNYVEKSIEGATQWVVFEPNDYQLWAKVLRDVRAFLTMVWRDGALFGQSPDQAFYVKCDEELNPSASRDLGRLVVEIGMAPVKPAEFVIFRISQWSPGA